MTDKEIEKTKEDLRDTQNESDLNIRFDKLKLLAKKVGASTTRMVEGPFEETPSSRLEREEWLCSIMAGKKKGPAPMIEMRSRIENKITEAEIVHNIEVALQTETMINMCKATAKNYEIALRATKISLGSAIAAWAAVAVMILVAALTR